MEALVRQSKQRTTKILYRWITAFTDPAATAADVAGGSLDEDNGDSAAAAGGGGGLS